MGAMARLEVAPAVRSREIVLSDVRCIVTGPPEALDELGRVFPPRSSRPVSNVAADAVFAVQTVEDNPGRFRLLRNARVVLESLDLEELAPALDWAISNLTLERLGRRYLLLHAGAVAFAGRGLLLPAASGSGKTTLVAGLLAAGSGYLSDEVAVLSPDTLQLHPFPRSLCVKSTGRTALSRLYPALAEMSARRRLGGEAVWYLQPNADAWQRAPAAVRWVVAPRYLPGARTELRPMARSAMLAILLEQSFSVPAHGARGVTRLADLLQRSACYSLTVGSLATGVDALRELTANVGRS
jgi:hypothetical protein